MPQSLEKLTGNLKKDFLIILKSKLYKAILYPKVVYYTLFWRVFFRKFGKKSRVFGRISVTYPENIEFGNNATLNEGVILGAGEKIIIHDECRISSHVVINTGGLLDNLADHYHKPVEIKKGTWLCTKVVVNPGVTIGSNCIVYPGSIITKDIPDNVVVAGAPAKIIRSRK